MRGIRGNKLYPECCAYYCHDGQSLQATTCVRNRTTFTNLREHSRVSLSQVHRVSHSASILRECQKCGYSLKKGARQRLCLQRILKWNLCRIIILGS